MSRQSSVSGRGSSVWVFEEGGTAGTGGEYQPSWIRSILPEARIKIPPPLPPANGLSAATTSHLPHSLLSIQHPRSPCDTTFIETEPPAYLSFLLSVNAEPVTLSYEPFAYTRSILSSDAVVLLSNKLRNTATTRSIEPGKICQCTVGYYGIPL